LKHPNAKLKIFLSNQISDEKLQKFIDKLKIESSVSVLRGGGSFGNVEFNLSVNPKQQAVQLGNKGWINLRGSQDDIALIGFRTIAYELISSGEEFDAVFVPASSGTTALGIYQGFQEFNLFPQMHVVQTTDVHALVKRIAHWTSLPTQADLPAYAEATAGGPDVNKVTLNKSAADLSAEASNIEKQSTLERQAKAESIVDMIGLRRLQIEEMIKGSNGAGWIISNDEVEKAKRELASLGVEASYDSALTFAAFKKATKNKKFRNPAMVFTG
jgi:threonine synthase